MFNVYLKDEHFKEPEEMIYYLLAANGLFQVKKSVVFTASTLVFEPKLGRRLGWLNEHSAGITLGLAKKIPFYLVEQAINFFRGVYKNYDGSEAIILLYWDGEKNEYIATAPEQEVGLNTLPKYKVGENPEGKLRVATVHSHGKGYAFHSGVDKADEEHDDGLHITIGNVNFIPSFACSIVCNGDRIEVNPEDVIECKEATAAVPQEWAERVKKVAPPPPRTYPYAFVAHTPGKKNVKGKFWQKDSKTLSADIAANLKERDASGSPSSVVASIGELSGKEGV